MSSNTVTHWCSDVRTGGLSRSYIVGHGVCLTQSEHWIFSNLSCLTSLNICGRNIAQINQASLICYLKKFFSFSGNLLRFPLKNWFFPDSRFLPAFFRDFVLQEFIYKFVVEEVFRFHKKYSRLLQICWLMNHYRTRHARAANPFHCVIEGCQMRFSTTYRLEEHVRVEHINPPKPGSLFYLRFCLSYQKITKQFRY